LKLKTVVTRLNRREFFQMKRFAKNLGLEFRFDALVNERIDHGRSVINLRMSPQEVMELDLTDPARGPEFARLFKRAQGFRLDPNSLFWCGAGVNSFHIDPHGRLMGCLMARDASYDLRLGSFRKGWQEFLPGIREQRFTKPTRCVGCDLRSICDQCPGWSQLESGDPEVPVDYLCDIAHLRAEAYGIGAGDSLSG
jgi:radical SAM protein with 4Fe4S-binding SPASM domain